MINLLQNDTENMETVPEYLEEWPAHGSGEGMPTEEVHNLWLMHMYMLIHL